jgi:hypothetical protein
LLGGLLTLWAGGVWAGSGSVLSLPNTGARPKHRLTLRIDTRWVDANGYRPVRIEAVNWPPGPTTADRSFRIVLRPRAWMYGYGGGSVTGFLEIPQGSLQAQTTVAVPQDIAWNALEIQVYEDGELLDDLSLTVGIAMRNVNQWSEAIPAILIIDAEAPGWDQREQWLARGQLGGPAGAKPSVKFPNASYLVSAFPEAARGGYPLPRAATPSGTPPSSAAAKADSFSTLRVVQDFPRLEMLPPHELPERWIDYTCFDMVFISLADLRLLIQQHPERWSAVRDWASSGPTLVVYDVDLDSPQLAELEQLLGFRPADGRRDASAGWQKPDERNADATLRALETQTQLPVPAPAGSRGSRSPAKKEEKASPKDDKRPPRVPFLIRPFGLGRVAAVRSDEPFAPGRHGMGWLFNELDGKNWIWYQRHGVSLNRQNKDFWNLMIPGVGRAPVTWYLILISLFALAIGPVNYLLLRRKRRLYLLLVTVPAGAAVVTFALFNYALISDGLGVRVRARSFTEIDQQQGRAVSWSRQCYYAGLAPSRGLQFPTDAAVYPLVQEAGDMAVRGAQSRRHLVWGDSQHLASGFLAARTSSQFVVVRAHTTGQGLAVAESGEAAQPPEVTNQLGEQIDFVVLADAQGRLFSAENVPTGERFRPQPTELLEVRRVLRTALSDTRPAFPPGYDIRYYGRRFGFRRFSPWYTDPNLPPATLETSLLERNLNDAAQSSSPLPPRSYVVILHRAPESLLGYPASREEASFHLVSGRW